MVARLLGRCRLLAQSPEHSAGQRQQVGALSLAPRAILVRPIGYISLLAVRHSSDERNLTDVTGSYKVSRDIGGAVDSTLLGLDDLDVVLVQDGGRRLLKGGQSLGVGGPSPPI